MTTLAPQVDESFLLAHADDNLIIAQRLSEYMTKAPDLEQDIAVANFALDHLGVAMHLYDYAAEIAGGNASRDAYAMGRTERDFRNVLLVEQPHPDYAYVTVRSLLFDVYQEMLWPVLTESDDSRLSGIAGRAEKEARYHRRHSETWLIRLGDGTDESGRRAQVAVDDLWRFTAELFRDFPSAGDAYAEYTAVIADILDEATLTLPEDPYQAAGGRDGRHSEQLGHILTEMQWLARSYPDASW